MWKEKTQCLNTTSPHRPHSMLMFMPHTQLEYKEDGVGKKSNEKYWRSLHPRNHFINIGRVLLVVFTWKFGYPSYHNNPSAHPNNIETDGYTNGPYLISLAKDMFTLAHPDLVSGMWFHCKYLYIIYIISLYC